MFGGDFETAGPHPRRVGAREAVRKGGYQGGEPFSPVRKRKGGLSDLGVESFIPVREGGGGFSGKGRGYLGGEPFSPVRGGWWLLWEGNLAHFQLERLH